MNPDSANRELYSLKLASYSIKLEFSSIGSGPCSIRSGPCSIGSGPYSIRSGPYSIRSGPYSIRSGPCSIRSGPYSIGSGLCSIDSGQCLIESGPYSIEPGTYLTAANCVESARETNSKSLALDRSAIRRWAIRGYGELIRGPSPSCPEAANYSLYSTHLLPCLSHAARWPTDCRLLKTGTPTPNSRPQDTPRPQSRTTAERTGQGASWRFGVLKSLGRQSFQLMTYCEMLAAAYFLSLPASSRSFDQWEAAGFCRGPVATDRVRARSGALKLMLSILLVARRPRGFAVEL